MPQPTTIREYITLRALQAKEERIRKLTAMGGADGVVALEHAALERIKAVGLVVGGDSSLLDRPYRSVRWSKGSGGKPYAEFDTAEGRVNYFPEARHRPYIAIAAR